MATITRMETMHSMVILPKVTTTTLIVQATIIIMMEDTQDIEKKVTNTNIGENTVMIMAIMVKETMGMGKDTIIATITIKFVDKYVQGCVLLAVVYFVAVLSDLLTILFPI